MLPQSTDATSCVSAIPTDRDSYRAWLATRDEAARRLIFGVASDATIFRCPANGRLYVDDAPERGDGVVWARCYWCDQYGKVRGADRDFARARPQPHSYPIVRETDA